MGTRILINYTGMVDILQRCLRSRDNQSLTSYFMETRQGMIQNMGRVEMDKGKRECMLRMRGNGLEQGERILGMILTRGKTHGEGV